MGVRVDNLITREYEQLPLFEADECDICFDIDERVKILMSCFGKLNFEKSAMSEELLSSDA